MTTGAAMGSTLLERADKARTDSASASPFELWQLAATEADGSEKSRRALYRHAMIHAGYLVTKAGPAYDVCPVCESTLA